MRQDVKTAIRDHITIPDHIHACAIAVAYDLNHGPACVLIREGKIENLTPDDIYSIWQDAEEDQSPGDVIAWAYDQPAETLRDFISNLPGTLYVDTDSGSVSDCEPESGEFTTEIDEDGCTIEIWYDNDMSSIYECDSRDIVLALFGQTIAREFRF
jgi:hypothetical protein